MAICDFPESVAYTPEFPGVYVYVAVCSRGIKPRLREPNATATKPLDNGSLLISRLLAHANGRIYFDLLATRCRVSLNSLLARQVQHQEGQVLQGYP